MKLLAILLLLGISASANADEFHVLVGYTCDIKKNQLTLTYDGAYNEDGEAMLKKKRKTQWEPWTLITVKDDGDHIESLKKVHGKCQLSDGTYKIEIFPTPGNFNIQGRCGAWMTAGATVTKGWETVYSINGFENDCMDTTGPITTRVVIHPGKAEPDVLTVKWEDFYK